MKRSLLKRLSGAIAAVAVALAGAFASIPAAHAATTYTLDQVGGTAKVTSFTYQGTQVKGYYPPNTVNIGSYVVPANGDGGVSYQMKVKLSIPLSQLNSGDKVNVGL